MQLDHTIDRTAVYRILVENFAIMEYSIDVVIMIFLV